jgi:hypothetical protein
VVAVRAIGGSRFTSSGYVAALLLVAFSATGLMAGMLTRQVSGMASRRGAPQSLPATAQTATAAAALTPSGAAKFTLKVVLAPNPARVGETVQLTVTAYTGSSQAVPGVVCTPQQTANAPTFAAWPGAQTTDGSGQARWSIDLASQTPPGSYQVSVKGESAGFKGSWYGTLVVSN